MAAAISTRKCWYVLLCGFAVLFIGEIVEAEDGAVSRVQRSADYQTLLAIHQKMIALSRRERSRRRLASECSKPVKRICKKMMRRCRPSSLNKRSVDFLDGGKFSAPAAYVIKGKSMHTVTKRSGGRRRRWYKVSCRVCRRKCYSMG